MIREPIGTIRKYSHKATVLVDGNQEIDADGRVISRKEYPKTFAVLKELFGRGDGKTTFNLPDLRSYYL